MDGTAKKNEGLRVGLDIGYGNLKVSSFNPSTNETQVIILPVGAGPAAKASKSMGDGRPDVGDGASVFVDGEHWVAGVSPLEIQDFARPTHTNYPKTREYLALYYAALSKLTGDEVDVLVVGLPVNQFYEGRHDGAVKALQGRLEGEHFVGPNRRVKVSKVVVVPQPAGAYTDLIQIDKSLADDKDRVALVLDVGYFSSDYVLVRSGKVDDQSSGSSTDATSRIIEDAARQIAVTNGHIRLSSTRLESAMRSNRDLLSVGERDIEFKPYVAAAASEVAERVMSRVFAALRSQPDMIDVVALTGGGGALFEPAVRRAFQSSKIAVSKDPVMANARGFMLMARSVKTSG